MPLHRFTFIGQGVYTLPEASRLTGIPGRRIRRWMEGYAYTRRGTRRESTPVIRPRFGRDVGELSLSFADLVEVRFLDAFLNRGVSFRAIRIAAERAQDLLSMSHPFSSHRFKTDGKDILAEIVRPGRDPELLNLIHNQYELRRVVLPLLHAGLDFDHASESAARWWPRGRRVGIVLDPLRSFGSPIIASAGVRTSILAASAAVDGDALAARLFSVRVNDVRRAVAYEAQPTQ